MKRLLSLALAAFMMAALLAGCGTNNTPTSESNAAEDMAPANSTEETAEDAEAAPATDGEETITWLVLRDWAEWLDPIVEKYEADTGVKVLMEEYAFNDLLEVIEVKIASGSTDYDIISVDVPLVAPYVNRGYLAEMDEYFSEEEKAGWISSALDAGSWQGTLYAPPMNTSSQLLWFNLDLLEQGGISLRESSVDNRLTYEEIEEYAREALSVIDPDGSNGIHGIVFQQVSRTYQMLGLPNSMGGDAIGDDGLTVDGVINDVAWINSMKWYQNLYNDGLALRGYFNEEVSDYFRADKVLFMIGGTWSQYYMGDTNWGYAPVPAFAGFEDQVGTPTGSWHFGINAASTKPDLAADFIKYMSLGEGNEMWIAAQGDIPSTVKGIEAINNDLEASEIDKIAAYEAANTSVPRPITPGYSEYSSIMDAAFEDIRNGADVEASLQDAIDQINSAFAKYKD